MVVEKSFEKAEEKKASLLYFCKSKVGGILYKETEVHYEASKLAHRARASKDQGAIRGKHEVLRAVRERGRQAAGLAKSGSVQCTRERSRTVEDEDYYTAA